MRIEFLPQEHSPDDNSVTARTWSFRYRLLITVSIEYMKGPVLYTPHPRIVKRIRRYLCFAKATHSSQFSKLVQSEVGT